jgi:hypothetical protein
VRRYYSARSLGRALGVTEREREEYGLRTIECSSISREERERRNRDKHAARMRAKRRKAGVRSRQQYLSEVKSRQPWRALGVSKATYYRRRLNLAGETGCVSIEIEEYSSHT